MMLNICYEDTESKIYFHMNDKRQMACIRDDIAGACVVHHVHTLARNDDAYLIIRLIKNKNLSCI
jgi:hypothetical protein